MGLTDNLSEDFVGDFRFGGPRSGTLTTWGLGGTLEGLLFGVAATDGSTTLAVLGTLTTVGSSRRSVLRGGRHESIQYTCFDAAERCVIPAGDTLGR